jgi:hypothetical protein
MKKLCRITEAEVTTEFLKAEFYRREYDGDRAKFEAIVFTPNLANEGENILRRALLFRRRGSMWRELPDNTQWWEIELESQDLEKVNVFPRAQWRRISDGNFQALHVAQRLREQMAQGKSSELLSKLQVLRANLQAEGPKSTVLLIGIDEDKPVTLLEGNHRFVSSLLLPRDVMQRRLRLVCGFSPNMEQCCWYKTDFSTLLHYTKNRIKYMWTRDADVTQLALQVRESETAGSLTNAIGFPNAKSE